jgi:hypothetical protein
MNSGRQVIHFVLLSLSLHIFLVLLNEVQCLKNRKYVYKKKKEGKDKWVKKGKTPYKANLSAFKMHVPLPPFFKKKYI